MPSFAVLPGSCRHRRRGGFTLIELLVVIGIIAVLISILLPALAKARDQAIRIRSASNLHQWGQAIFMYANESKGRLFMPFSNGSSPGICWAYNDSDGTASESEWTMERMSTYLGGWNQVTPEATMGAGNNDTIFGAWVDPSVTSEAAAPGWFWPGAWCAAWMHYAYFGDVDEWGTESGGTATATPAQLTAFVGSQLNDDAADKVLMADLLAYFSTNTAPYQWAYNHGFVGSGANAIWNPDAGDSGSPNPGTIQNVSGINELFGDGHVIWKNPADLQTKLLATQPFSQPYGGTLSAYSTVYY